MWKLLQVRVTGLIIQISIIKMERKNKISPESMKRSVVTLFFAILINILFINFVNGQSMPLSIHGTVYELDGTTQAPRGTFISINNTFSGYYAEGETGTFFNPGRYSASIQGNIGDEVIITASNGFNDVSVVVSLQGSMRNIDLFLNTICPDCKGKRLKGW